jgi:hypothetical protein
MRRFLSAFMLATCLAGQAQADGWCPPGPESASREESACVLNVSTREANERRDAWYEARRHEAEQLPVSYEDIIVAALTAGVRREDRYCLKVFNAKPSKSLLARLRALERKANACTIRSNGDFRMVFRIRQLRPDWFEVGYGSSCGPPCGPDWLMKGWLVTVRRRMNGSWGIESEIAMPKG